MSTATTIEPMRVVKYFFEEPASFEPEGEAVPGAAMPHATTEEAAAAIAQLFGAPRLYRGYLSASDLTLGTTGATASADAWIGALLSLLVPRALWTAGETEPVPDREDALRTARHSLLVAAASKPPMPLLEAAATAGSGPAGRTPLLRLAQDGLVLTREPTFDGWDWSLLSREPLAERVREAFRTHPVPDARCWVIPLREARGEHRFHFEKYDLELYRRHEVRAR